MWKTKWGRCIYTSPSGYKVHQNILYRWLTLGSDALQTMINRYNPQQPVLYYIPALALMTQQLPGKTCLLGLGGAGVAHWLSAKNRDQKIIAVESSEEVIYVARHFFKVDDIPGLQLIHSDALDYLYESNILFDHLLIDLYDAHNFPTTCATDNFFMLCKKRLKEEGFLAINLANFKEQWPIFQLVQKQFPHTLIIPIKKSANIIIIASKSGTKEQFTNTIRDTEAFKKIVWMDLWGYTGILF